MKSSLWEGFYMALYSAYVMLIFLNNVESIQYVVILITLLETNNFGTIECWVNVKSGP